MNKVPIRPRQIDSNRPLAVLREGKNVNFNQADFVSVGKGSTNFITGMEKDEESEHHLQQVLSANSYKKISPVGIPVPEIIDVSSEYESLYSAPFALPNHLVTTQGLDTTEEKDLDYDIDTADENWLSSNDVTINYETFETLMDCFEKSCGKKVPSLKEALALARRFTTIRKEIAIAVYDYWLEKRSCHAEGFIHNVKQDSQDPTANNADSYVAFRRRSEKMQTRRHRRSDELSYEKMFRFHQSLLQLKGIVQSVYLREMTKKILAQNSMQVDQLRLKIGATDPTLYATVAKESANYTLDPKAFIRKLKQKSEHEKEFPRNNKRQRNSSLSKDISDNDSQLESSTSESEFEFVRTEGSQYARTKAEFLQPETLNPPVQMSNRYSLCSVPNVCHGYRNHWCGYTRPRFGRLGRRVLDRIHPTDASSAYFAEVSELPRKIPRLEQHPAATAAFTVQFRNEDGTCTQPFATSFHTDISSSLRGHYITFLDPSQSLKTPAALVFCESSYSSVPATTITSSCNTDTTTSPTHISTEKTFSSLSLGHANGIKSGSANGSDSGMGSAPSTPPAAISTALSLVQLDKESVQLHGLCNEMKSSTNTTTVASLPSSNNNKRAFMHSVDATRFIKEYKAGLPHKCFPENTKLWKNETQPLHVLHESS